MEIEIIENIVSELPLFIIKGGDMISVPNVEAKRITKRMIEANSKRAIIEDGFSEGGVIEILAEVKRQKRNPKLREEAIREYGYSCCVCGFKFEDVYGDLGVGYIEVHHLVLLSAIKDERFVTVNDVAVVCANCHRVLHRNGKEPMLIDQLRDKVQELRKRNTHI